MQRLVLFLAALAAAALTAGLALAFSRPFPWPNRIRAIEWRALGGLLPEAPEAALEAVA